MHSMTIVLVATLAQRANWQRLGDHFRRTGGDPNTDHLLAVVAIVVAFAIGLFVLHRVAQRRDRSKSYDSPPELFRELCRAHRLNPADRRLLKRLAGAWGLSSDDYLFIEPDYFETSKLGPEWKEEALRVKVLRERLFGAA